MFIISYLFVILTLKHDHNLELNWLKLLTGSSKSVLAVTVAYVLLLQPVQVWPLQEVRLKLKWSVRIALFLVRVKFCQ